MILKIALILHLLAPQVGISKKLLTEVVRAESNFNPQALSSAGAKGLMQLTPIAVLDVHLHKKELPPVCSEVVPISEGKDQLYNPTINLIIGSCFLKLMLDKAEGDVTMALASYNCGRSCALKKNWPKETREYVNRIKKRLEK